MKGTIDASIPHAEEKILSDEKEHWEHNTIVDLIRNDLSIVSEDVHVPRFRYIDRLKTSQKELLQVSSEIKGKLPENWQSNIGDMLLNLLPAGSISGAPKAKTVEVIRESEGQDRGYFTGIFGIYEDKSLDSAVNIRFIEKTHDGFQFRSGGGITAKSNMEEEYREMIHKVYVPLA
jgi:para-aminobenzoate synthetase component 1